MSISTKRFLRGLMKSWTVHAGTYMAVIGYLQTQNKLIEQWFGADALGIIMMVFGLLAVVLRAKTTDSLENRGK